MVLLCGCVGEFGAPSPGWVPTAASGGGGGAGPSVASGGGAAPFVPPSPAPLYAAGAYGRSALARLTKREVLSSVESIFGVAPGAAGALAPADSPSGTYFQNDSTALSITDSWISQQEAFASAYAAQVRAQPAPLAARVGCTPAGPGDASCFRRTIEVLGRRMLRRPITGAEVQRWSTDLLPFAVADGSFFSAVELLVAAWLQHPEFLYRVEAQVVPAGQVRPLSPFEVATRIAFFTTGQAPDDALLDAAAANALGSEAERAAHAERLLASPEGLAHAQHLHARWLGYTERFLPPAIEADALKETQALVARVTGDAQAPWLSLLTASQTWVTPALAGHYGLPAPSGAGDWVSYPAGRGGGVLSHALIASLGAKFGDTSPTLRGYALLKRLYCGKLVGAIPPGVNLDDPPGSPSDCKAKRYFQRNAAGCAHCHSVTDDLGFGLENLGAYGEWRTVEPNNASCTISGEGAIQGQAFVGPQALGALAAQDPRVLRCAGQQLFELLVGRPSLVDDAPTLDALQGQALLTPSFRALMVALVRSPALTHKGGN